MTTLCASYTSSDFISKFVKLFAATEDCIAHLSSLPLDEINEVLTEKEKRRAMLDPSRAQFLKGKDYSRLRVSPNSPLAE